MADFNGLFTHVGLDEEISTFGGCMDIMVVK